MLETNKSSVERLSGVIPDSGKAVLQILLWRFEAKCYTDWYFRLLLSLYVSGVSLCVEMFQWIFELFALWGLFTHLEISVNIVPWVFCGFEILIFLWSCRLDVNLWWVEEHQRVEENDCQWLIASWGVGVWEECPFLWRSLRAHVVRLSLTTCKLRNRFQN